MRKQTKKWTTKEGKKIRICDMSDSHLLNSIKMIERQSRLRLEGELSFYMSCPLPNGEMAQDGFDQEFDALLDATPDDFLPCIYYNLVDDARRRGIYI